MCASLGIEKIALSPAFVESMAERGLRSRMAAKGTGFNALAAQEAVADAAVQRAARNRAALKPKLRQTLTAPNALHVTPPSADLVAAQMGKRRALERGVQRVQDQHMDTHGVLDPSFSDLDWKQPRNPLRQSLAIEERLEREFAQRAASRQATPARMEQATAAPGSGVRAARGAPEMATVRKVAGFRDALTTALTGRVPLRHGTSAARATAIRAKGLVPDAAPGVSGALGTGLDKAQEGLAFTTRAPAVAANYAKQQQGLDAYHANVDTLLPKVREWRQKRLGWLDKGLGFLPKEHRDVAEVALKPVRDQLTGDTGAAVQGARMVLPKKPAKDSIVEMRVPRGHVAANEAASVEGRAAFDETPVGKMLDLNDLPPGPLGPLAVEAVAMQNALPFSKDVIMRGGVSTKYIKGSPDYQGVTLDELRQHAASVRQDPREYAKDVMRSYTELSHRPSKILGLHTNPPVSRAKATEDLLKIPWDQRPGTPEEMAELAQQAAALRGGVPQG